MTGADRPLWCLGVEAISGDSSSCHVAVRGRGNKGCWPSPDVTVPERGSYRTRRNTWGGERPQPTVDPSGPQTCREERAMGRSILGAVGATQ